MPGLLRGVRRVEGLDPVEADVADEALDQVANLVGILDVPVGMGDDGDPAGVVDQLDGLLGGRPACARRTPSRRAPGTPRRTGRGRARRRPPWRCAGGRSRRRRRPWRRRPRSVTSTPWELSRAMISLARSTRSCWARSQAGRMRSGRPSSRRCAGPRSTCARRTSRPPGTFVDPGLLGRRGRLRDAGDPVVVGQRHHRHPGLGGGAGDVGRLRAGRRRRSNGTAGRSLRARDPSGEGPRAGFLTPDARIDICGSQRRPTTRCERRSSSRRARTASRSRASGWPSRRRSRCSSSSTSCSSSSTRG